MTCPAALFARLWRDLTPHAGDIITRPWAGRHAQEYDALVALLLAAPGSDVPPELETYLAGDAAGFNTSVAAKKERAFVAMCAIDEAAKHIHPAFPRRLPGYARSLSPMLEAMRAKRTATGFYADVAGIGMVVPKGHLASRQRPNDAEEASGTQLAHQFECLSIIAHPANGHSLRVIAPSPRRFDVGADRSDRVGLAPIAEDRDDLAFEVSERGKRPYLDTRPAAAPLGDRINNAVTALLDDGAGVIVLPELVAPPGSAESLRQTLKARGAAATPALIVAGTGATTEIAPGSGRPYNEAVLLSADGKELARQRKLHVFNMRIGRMRDCAISPVRGYGNRSHMEDAQPGTELVVCDLHGLGRVMVLICEDLEQSVPTGTLVESMRPDWILTPVLDIAQEIGRWTHNRATELARKSLSRVVVSGSTTLSVRHAGQGRLADIGEGVNAGVCVDGLEEKKFRMVATTGALSPERMIVEWEPAHWRSLRMIGT